MKVDDGHDKTQEPNARFMSQHHRGLDGTALVPLSGFTGTYGVLRYSPGLAPTTRLNALLNAASDS